MNKYLYATGLGCLTLLPVHGAEIANSITEFSQNQGNEGWTQGWRNFTADGKGDESYDPLNDFIPFTAAQWRGTIFSIGGNPPWTQMGPEDAHPNGTNNGPEHWVIHRWVATELTQVAPLRLSVSHRKSNPNGGGTTVALYQNGIRRFTRAVEGADDAGYTVDVFLNVLPGDRIDLALTPANFNGTSREDGSDGTRFSVIMDDDLGAGPHIQPNGSTFIPANNDDSDADGMPDVWERIYTNGGLTVFKNGGDFDGDGLQDQLEYARGSDPTKQDTDGDGLSDRVETKTGEWKSVTETGTDPAKPDTDGDSINDFAETRSTPPTDPNKPDTDDDGFTDPDEFFFGSNPASNADTPLTQAIADSVTDFSGIQGQSGWEYGYRDVTATGYTLNYDVNTAFIKFAGGSDNPDPWIEGLESTQQWNNGNWDIQNNAPWTEITPDGSHPNGINNSVEHWTIRRWKATELTAPTPVDLLWHVRKTNPNGDGVTGMVFLNGRILDSKTISGTDSNGVVRRVYLVLKPTDVVDLVLSPVGLQEASDGSDGSGTWLRVDKRLLPTPVSSDGAFFAAPGSADTDGDGLADAWEIYVTTDRSVSPPVPGTLTVLSSSTADPDQDGLTNLQEQTRGTDPLKADTDGDGLSDAVETATGVYVSANDTGSSPLRADTDGDGLSDFAEVTAVQLKTDPWLANTDGDLYNDANELRRDGDPTTPTEYGGNGYVSTVLAHSVTDFSGEQGPVWFNGYRNLTADGGETDYDPVSGFIPFENFVDNRWFIGAAPPWTGVWFDGAHPNGQNNAGSGGLNWAIRRWVADSSTVPAAKPLAFWWHLRKSGPSDTDGTTGALYLNGHLLDTAGVGGMDVQGVTRVVYANIALGDKVDLALLPNGPGLGFTEGFDYADSSFLILGVSDVIPAGAVQPDGSAFPPVSTAGFDITSLTRNAANGQVTLTWPSQTGLTYDVLASESMAAGSWQTLTPAAGVAGTGAALTFTDTTFAPAPPAKQRVFYRVRQR